MTIVAGVGAPAHLFAKGRGPPSATRPTSRWRSRSPELGKQSYIVRPDKDVFVPPASRAEDSFADQAHHVFGFTREPSGSVIEFDPDQVGHRRRSQV
jgi:hypothetical protein